MRRNLAACETDTHNQCVLEKQRAKRVETVLEALSKANARKYIALYRAVQAEIADAYRQLAEIKHNEGRPYPKVRLQQGCPCATAEDTSGRWLSYAAE